METVAMRRRHSQRRSSFIQAGSTSLHLLRCMRLNDLIEAIDVANALYR
jgi:hypothetical protein